jgi:predicted DNA-binding transcriptional regulator YafY
VDTPTRLLRLLGLLSARAGWTGAELADRLGITERTLRRDIARLRDLGYPIEATTGPYGGYQLGAGGRLPPLVLDDDEAVAVALALRAVAGGRASGDESAALSALTKLDQVLPVLLRDRVNALATVTVGLRRGGLPPVDIDTLVTTALCCRNHETLRFDYRDANDALTNRHVQPYRVVFTDRQWYAVAFDLARDDWRTFRVDRMDWVRSTGTRFVPVDDPPDAAALVARGLAVAGYPETAVVRVLAPFDETSQVMPRTVAVLEPGEDGTTVARIGGDADWIARYLAGLDWPFELLEPDSVRTELHALARRLLDV